MLTSAARAGRGGIRDNFLHFLLAIFAGRFVRFSVFSLLTLKFGPQIVEIVGGVFSHHFYWIIAIVAAGILVWVLWRRKQRNGAQMS